MVTKNIKTLFVRAMYIMVVVAVALSVTQIASAQESALPEGWHDGTEGTVNAAGCSAFGWAADPDEPDRDLQIQIFADGHWVAETTANLLREDVEACPGGTCGFSVDLWGLISAGQAHQITAQAYDVETSAWVNLSGTSKTLTCWGYPEGFHDGMEGTVDTNSCSAFGWAVDPDNRNRDVLVQILSDGYQVTSINASDYGEDMDTLGICPGGTCRFTVDLWGLITPDEKHQITTQAYDEETNAWLDLEATHKSLTCQSPWLIAFPENDAVEGWEWPEGTTVTLTIDNAPGLEWSGTAEVTSWGDPRTYVRFDFADVYNLKVGDVVTLTDGTTTITHIVQNLSVTAVNAAENTVSGTADAEAEVQVWPHEFDQVATMQVFAGIDHIWLADFDDDGFDLLAEMGGRSQILVGRNATAVDWYISTPRFTVFPEWEYIESRDWPLGSSGDVHLEIDDPATEISPDFQKDASIGPTPWDPSGNLWALFGLNGDYDVKAGDYVTLTYGEMFLEHTVRALSVTDVNASTERISGKAEGDETVYVWPHGAWFEPLQAIAHTVTGTWQVDFTAVPFDLIPGIRGRSEVRDMNNNSTAVDWYVHPSYTGHWRAIDSYDQSNMQLTVSGGGNNQYQLTWTDDYWSVCGGPGIGRGSGRLDSGGYLRVDWVIKCRGAVVWNGQFDYILDLATGTLWDGANTWYLVSGK